MSGVSGRSHEEAYTLLLYLFTVLVHSSNACNKKNAFVVCRNDRVMPFMTSRPNWPLCSVALWSNVVIVYRNNTWLYVGLHSVPGFQTQLTTGFCNWFPLVLSCNNADLSLLTSRGNFECGVPFMKSRPN